MPTSSHLLVQVARDPSSSESSCWCHHKLHRRREGGGGERIREEGKRERERERERGEERGEREHVTEEEAPEPLQQFYTMVGNAGSERWEGSGVGGGTRAIATVAHSIVYKGCKEELSMVASNNICIDPEDTYV